METKDMLYIVTEYAKNGEMFGEFPSDVGYICWTPISLTDEPHNASVSHVDLN